MEDLNRNIIISRLVRNEIPIRQLGVEKVGLFGSYLTDQQNELSDVDILVEFKKDKNSYDNFINLCFLLDDLFQGKKVEVVTTNSLSPYIGPKILQQVEYAPFSS
ncbi:MAG: nucleotidyltransferase domain-containing protein [Bacteroidetes bacterium]|nr:nucleotidyltransferase domain-containing protein [Bacteroidota bacterium]